ncbi:N-acetyltransferase family protein [Pseudomonas putida]|jgi:GNAT superfamily N-acetyltransferase|uniref:GNAT family N-acetyltransferase n=1 Tax=Pseudomonas putida TaxID=303 RepID=A0A379KF70_PSEPU|nr:MULTISPECIES: GNAT family N-acetyltransferase [Pseudomonas]QPN45383.1 GNAT family N-acetyltransferase [Priestia aryabhattai]KAF1305863.1 GNAT family N-acetyltransferase [Pseudomonas sp. SG-MS2]MBG6125602.1 GNAT superfamily N-acetyltransferase [Pseudomonas sp. M2]MBM7398470.1 GNAT superfamily N-acetyltransferase [Pseudomonas sp. M5]NSX22538.1 GNAT family N-acetyltransferase [Pseudomonas putida]
MPNVILRPVSANDHAAWLPLWQAYLRFYQTELADEVSAVTWQRILDSQEPTHSALAWIDGKAVGMVNWIYHRTNWSIANACYLQDLYVDGKQRGLGVGRQLIELVNASAKAAGCCKVHWLTHETNATAIGLYEQVAERPGFIQFRQTL